MKFIKTFCILFFVTLTVQYCSQPEDPVVCTEIFKTYSVTVLNQNGEPADSVDIQVANESGRVYKCGEYLCRETSTATYTIMHDGLQKEISDQKETIVVEGIKGDWQFKEEFEFRAGECHVEKIAGPDTVSLASN